MDADDRARLARARSLTPGDPPAPWGERVVIPASGGLAVGWDDAENVVLISWDGYSVTVPHTGERLVRDRDRDRTYAALSPHYLTFTLPHTGHTIPVFGLVSGDGNHYTHDGWALDVIAPWWPRLLPRLSAPAVRGVSDSYEDRAYAIALTRLADWEWLCCGFSPSGQHFLLFNSGGAEIFSREDISPVAVPRPNVQVE